MAKKKLIAERGDTIASLLFEGTNVVLLSGYNGVSIIIDGKTTWILHGRYVVIEERTQNASVGKNVDTFLKEQTDNNLRGVFA